MYRYLLLPVLATTALQANAEEPRRIINSELKRFFIEASIANNEHTLGMDGYDGDVEERETSFNFKAGYWFSEIISVAVGYQNFGEVEYSELNTSNAGVDFEFSGKGKAFTLSGIASTAQWKKPWRFYAELGLAKWDYTWDIKASSGFDSESAHLADDSGVDIWGGLGAGYAISDNLELNLSAQWFTMEPELTDTGEFIYDNDQADLQISRLALGLNYQF